MSDAKRLARLFAAASFAVCLVAPVAQAQAPAPVTAQGAAPAAAAADTAAATVTPAATSAAPVAETETIANPYGLDALWRNGDFIARGTLIVLAVMSLGSWFILLTKFVEQSRLLSAGRA